MICEFNYPKHRDIFEKYIDENPHNFLWHDGQIMRVYTDDDIPSACINDALDAAS